LLRIQSVWLVYALYEPSANYEIGEIIRDTTLAMKW
jgi:hypothetical protein